MTLSDDLGRWYEITLRLGAVRVFRSVQAFDGYVCQLRRMGNVVVFTAPNVCHVVTA